MYMQQGSQYCSVLADTASICHIEAQTNTNTIVFHDDLNTNHTGYVLIIQAKNGCFGQKKKKRIQLVRKK